MAEITRDIAMRLWRDCFGDARFASDCFGTYICRDGWGNEPYITIMPGGNGKKYDYSWNVDHIRPKASYENENDADTWGNLEPMHRQNNQEKADNCPGFSIDGKSYKIVRDGYGGYGIINSNDTRIDQKARNNFHY